MRLFTKITVRTGLFFLLGLTCCGCGIKGPPVPPQQLPVPTVLDLAYQVDAQTVTLSWSLSGPLAIKQAKQATFGIYRSRNTLAEPPCEGCPRVYEKVATIPYVHTDTNLFTTSLPLDPGYRYGFKVRVETDGGIGTDSKVVQFDYGY